MNVINLTSLSAYNLLEGNAKSCIIDVRTKNEQIQNGIPKLENELFSIEWRDSDMKLNESFQREFKIHTKNIDHLAPLFFMCQSGGRSYEAATFIAKAGFANCYNIVDGFNGGTWGAGWKQNDLPWQMIA
jgi:rhodanese-related sulfurtransferase